MDARSAKRTRNTCYFTYLAMASVFSLPPLLFAIFHETYHISYTLLGTLVLINFCTQLTVDLLFSLFGKYFNMQKTVRVMPLITTVGMLIYGIVPALFPEHAYTGLVVGTLVFSFASGMAEVLLSPTVAAVPSDNPEADMSTLHSLYGYGFLMVVVISTLFLEFVGKQYWMYLTLFWALVPIISSILFFTSKLPDMNIDHEKVASVKSKHRTKSLALCFICIFLGAAAENTMSAWVSVYVETALHLPKVWGDIFGMALFAILLAFVRTLYAKYGKNIMKTLTISMLGAFCCYILITFINVPLVGLFGCAAVGIFTSMLWPGTLILMEEEVPAVGVTAFALMAAGGDFGASFAPQMLGIAVDNIALTDLAASLSAKLSMSAEQIAFKGGMLLASVFPLLGVLLLLYMKKHFSKVKA